MTKLDRPGPSAGESKNIASNGLLQCEDSQAISRWPFSISDNFKHINGLLRPTASAMALLWR